MKIYLKLEWSISFCGFADETSPGIKIRHPEPAILCPLALGCILEESAMQLWVL